MGAPCTLGNRDVIWMARIASAGVIMRIEVTILPEKRPAGTQSMFVRYIGAIVSFSM